MKDDLKKFLSEFAIYTAVPADLIAIVTVIVQMFKDEGKTDGPVTITVNSLNFALGRDFFIVLVIYAVIGLLYWLVTNINEKTGQQKYAFIKTFSISIPLALGIPLLLILITFGQIPAETGFALLSIGAFVNIFTYLRWSGNQSHTYNDIGLWYLAWIPIAWLFLQFSNSETWLEHWGLAWIYAALGYLLSFLMVTLTIFLFILPRPNIKNLKHALELFQKFYVFDLDRGWGAFVTFIVLFFVGYIALAAWLLKHMLPIIIGLVMLIAIALLSYWDLQLRKK